MTPSTFAKKRVTVLVQAVTWKLATQQPVTKEMAEINSYCLPMGFYVRLVGTDLVVFAWCDSDWVLPRALHFEASVILLRRDGAWKVTKSRWWALWSGQSYSDRVIDALCESYGK